MHGKHLLNGNADEIPTMGQKKQKSDVVLRHPMHRTNKKFYTILDF